MEKLNTNDIIYEGQTYKAKIGTDNRVWYIGEGKSEKEEKPAQKSPQKPKTTKETPKKNLLREHLQSLAKDKKLPSADNQKTEDNNNMKEGESINLNKD